MAGNPTIYSSPVSKPPNRNPMLSAAGVGPILLRLRQAHATVSCGARLAAFDVAWCVENTAQQSKMYASTKHRYLAATGWPTKNTALSDYGGSSI